MYNKLLITVFTNYVLFVTLKWISVIYIFDKLKWGSIHALQKMKKINKNKIK